MDWIKTGERIRGCRTDLKLTQEVLAQKISEKINTSIKRQTVAGWERGKPIAKLKELQALCEIFECDSGYLLCEVDTKRVLSQPFATYLGISEDAIECLMTAAKDKSPILQTISDLILDSLGTKEHEIIDQITYCISAYYGSPSTTYPVEGSDPFNKTKYQTLISANNLYRSDLLGLYRSIYEYIDQRREEGHMEKYY